MNKFRAFIMTIVFAASAIPGFYFGKTTSLFVYPFFRQQQSSETTEEIALPELSGTPDKYSRATQMPRPSVTPIVLPAQEKILLIQVDNLTLEKPQMISVWGLFIAFSDHPNLIFKAIYPSAEDRTSLQQIRDLFEIEPDGKLSEAYLANLNALGIEWDGYLLVDNTFIDEYGSAFLQTSLSPFLPSNQKAGAILNQEEIFLNKTCNYLVQQEKQFSDDFDWTTAASGHIQSDLELDFLLLGWQWLIEKGTIENCEVLT